MCPAAVRLKSAACRLVGSLLLSCLLADTAAAQSVTDGTTPSGLAPGAPAGSYPLSGFDTVNFFNGGLNFNLPLLTLGGRGGAAHTIPVRIENKWRVQKVTSPTRYYAHDGWWTVIPPGYGTGALEGRAANMPDMDLCQGGGEFLTVLRLTFTAPDGTEYELVDADSKGAPGLTRLAGPPPGGGDCTVDSTPDRGKVFVTTDGSAATFLSDVNLTDAGPEAHAPSGYLMTRDGTRYGVDEGRVTWMRDRNGNLIEFKYTGAVVTEIGDSLGRTVTISYRTQTQLYDEISYKGFGGQPHTIRVNYSTLQASLRSGSTMRTDQLFPQLNGSGDSVYNPTSVVSSVVLPDDRQYAFKYNAYGELARVELPTGGAVEYDWEGGLTGGNASGVIPGWDVYRRVVERRIYPGGGTGASYERKMTISKPEDAAGGNLGYVVVEQRDSAGILLSKERHYYHGSARSSFSHDPLHYAGYREGREWKTELLRTDGSDLPLRSVEQMWQQPAAGQTWPLTQAETSESARANDPQVTQTLTTLADAGLVSEQTFAYDRYSNRTDTYEYDYGPSGLGAFIRRTHTDYMTAAAYVNAHVDPAQGAHLRALPSQQWVSSDLGGASKASFITYDYDNYSTGPRNAPLLPRAEITGLCLTLDGAGACEKPSDAGFVTRGNVTGVTSYSDAGAQPAPSGPVTVSTQYDVAGNVIKTVDRNGKDSSVSYADSFCNGTTCGGTSAPNTFAFATGTTSAVPDETGHGSSARFTTSVVYDFWTGKVRHATDANGQFTSFEYDDDLDRLTRVVRPSGAGETRYEYEEAAGNPSGTTYVETFTKLDDSPRETYSFQFFDGLGRPTRTFQHVGGVIASGGDKYLTAVTEYDALGRAHRVSTPFTTSGSTDTTSQPAGWTESTFDALGRVTKVKTTADGAEVLTAYAGQYVTVTDQAGKVRRSKTDSLGRLVRVDEPDASGSLGPVESPIQPTSYRYDALGNLRKVEQGTQRRFFMYDSLSRLIRLKNPEQGNFTPGVDFPAKTDTSVETPGNSEWSLGYVYDPNGNLTKRIDARGVVATYTHDNLGRNTTITYSDSTPAVGRYYDNPSNSTANAKGRLWYSETSGASGSKTVLNSYDAAGRPVSQSHYFKTSNDWGPGFTTSLEYNLMGSVTKQTYPSGREIKYAYDVAGRLADAGSGAAFRGTLGDGAERTYASEVLYDSAGRRAQERYGTQTPVFNKSFYNSRGQLAEVRVSTHPITASGQEKNWNRGAIFNHYFTGSAGGCDTPGGSSGNNGNLRKQDICVPNADDYQSAGHWRRTQTYAYDSLNRLDEAEERAADGSLRWRQDYEYDRWGNRTINSNNTTGGVNATQFPVDQNTNQLKVPVGSPSQMVYDPAGNLTIDTYTGQGTRTFDAENRMTSAQDKHAQTSSYVYDADGRRVRRLTGDAEVWQVYGVGGELLAEYAANAPDNSPQKEYGYRSGELLVVAEAGAAPSLPPGQDSVWFEDSTPTGAALYGNGESWSWVGANPTPYAGTSAHQSASASGHHNHYFTSATQTMPVAAGDRLYAHVFIDPSDQPQELMLQWHDGTTWYNAYWGADNINWVGARIRVGNLPTAGQWVRLEVSAAVLGLEGKTVSGLAFNLWDGRATFDQAGKSAAQPETVWVEDGLPTGAQPFANNESWTWVSSGPSPYSGSSAHQSADAVGFHNHYFTSATQTLSVAVGEKLFSYVWINPQDVPSELMLQWHDGTTWKNAYWGSDQIQWVGPRVRIGDVPAAGGWVRLEVPASALGLEGKALSGMAFNLWDGQAAWDRAGKSPSTSSTGPANMKWLVSDHLGTPRMVIDHAGSLAGVKRHDYFPFGEEISSGTGGRTTAQGYVADNVRQKFTGYERDVETELDFARARYYSPTMGRFTSVDPLDPVLGKQGASDKEEAEKQFVQYLGQPQHWNRYSYALNNPLRYTDTDGFAEKLVVNLNIIFDRGSYTESQKRAFINAYVDQAVKNFGNEEVNIEFNISYSEGTATNVHNNSRKIDNPKEGALNVFVSKGRVGNTAEVTQLGEGKGVFLSTHPNYGNNPGNLTHGIIHALGIFQGFNGFTGGSTGVFGGLRELYTSGNAEYHTQALQDHLRKLSNNEYASAAAAASAGVGAPYGQSIAISAIKPDMSREINVIREGARKYLKK